MAAAEKYLGDLMSEGCVNWWCPIVSGCWPEVRLNRFSGVGRWVLNECMGYCRLFVDFKKKQGIRELYSRLVGGGNATCI